jgi:PAS domain S-box-containing protein
MFSILYVDDEPSLLEIGKLFLENSGMFSVDTVTSAPKALLALAKKRYDAIISDYQMPEMDGIEFLKQVRASGNIVPFIIFTGRGREEIVIQALNEGADFYLQKGGEPVSQFAELEHKVQVAVLQRKAEASIRDHERREADIINFLPDATFAIDTKGVVIAWNRAMEKMTGVKTSEILGKDNYEYAIPFYHERRPILIDLVLNDDPETEGKYPAITRDGTTLFSEITIPHFNNGTGAELWFTASPLFDTHNTIVGAIESIREITERKQAEEALHESERKFRELSDLLPQVVYEVDTGGNLTYANKIAFAWFRYSEEEVRKGLNILDMVVPHDRDRAAAAIRAMLEGKRSGETAEEYLALRKDGSTFPISIYSSPVDVNGRITGLRGIIVDTTERKKAEYDLKNSVAFLNSLIDQSPTPMWIADERGILILTNKACCDLLRVDEAEVIGKYNIFNDNIIREQGFMSLVRNVFEKGIVARFPIIYDTKHLNNLHLDQFVSLVLDVTVFPVHDAGGKITNAVTQLTNITERKKAEDALIESEVRFRSLIQNASDMIRIVDRQGKIIYESPSTEKIMGYPAGENIGKDSLRYIHPDDIERVKCDLQEVYDRKNPGTPTEFRVKKSDGSYIWVDAIATNLLGIPAVNGIVVTTRPIEQRKKMEAAILESEEKYRNVVEDQTEMISRFLPDGTHVFVNEAYCRYFGMKRDEILMHRFLPKIPVEDQERVKHFFESLTQERPVDTIEHRIIMPGNSIKWQRWSDRAIFDSSGKVVEYQSVGRDVTEKKEAEEALRQSQDELRAACEQLTASQEELKRQYNELAISEQRIRESQSRLKFMLGFYERTKLSEKNLLSYAVEGAGTVTGSPLGYLAFLNEDETKLAMYAWSQTSMQDCSMPEKPIVYEVEQTGLWGEAVRERRPVVTNDYQSPDPRKKGYPSGHPHIIRHMNVPVMDGDHIVIVAGVANKPSDYTDNDVREISLLMQGLWQVLKRRRTEEALRTANEQLTAREEALQESESKYRHIIENIQDAYFRADRNGNLTMVSPSAARIYGYGSPDEMIGIPAALLYTYPGQRQEVIQKLQEGGTVTDFIGEGMKKDGTRFWVSLNVQGIVDNEGQSNGTEGFVRDITERKNLEQAIHEINRKLNLLSSITRHDVSNQVSVLRGFAKIAMMKKPEPVIVDLLAKIDATGAVIDRHIAFTKAYQELGLHAPGWHRINELVAHQKTHGITLSCTCEAEVFSDPMIENVFFNLIDNAARHGEHVTTITVNCKPSLGGMVISVEDNGIGVPLDKKEKIFEKGYGKHTGFGLFLAREILGITGITIHETGICGKNARFEIHVPKGKYRGVALL